MHGLIGIAGLLFVGAVTPGPNNLVVLRQAVRGGWRAVVPDIVGILSGSLALLVLIFAGAGSIFVTQPWLAVAITWAGCLYLSWLGVQLVIGSFKAGSQSDPDEQHGLPAGAVGLFVFQFLNPKAWILILTVVSSAQSLGVAVLPTLAVLQVVIFAASLLAWSSFGVLLMRHLRRRAWRAWFDRVMGALLIASAMMLLIGS